MARPLRILFEGAWYHVMHRGANHQNIFFDGGDKHYFLNLLNELTDIYGIEIHVYCLMSNHYHMVFRTPRGNLSEAMKYFNSKYTQFINAKWKRDGSLFRGRYKAILIGADDYLLKVSRYIHLNPIKAKMVYTLSNYPWSSYRYYISKKSPPPWLVMREIKYRFNSHRFSIRYKNYVENGNDNELDNFYASTKFNPVLGDNNFRELIDNYINKHSLSSEIVGADNIIIPPSISSILEAVSLYYKIEIQTITKRSRQKLPARSAAIYICRKVGGYRLSEIADVMGGMIYTGISKSVCRSEQNKILLQDIGIITKRLLKKTKKSR